MVQNDRKGKKKKKWGPVLAERKSSGIVIDGRTSLEKAQDNKKKSDMVEGRGKVRA
jgi:hypothetical protein